MMNMLNFEKLLSRRQGVGKRKQERKKKDNPGKYGVTQATKTECMKT